MFVFYWDAVMYYTRGCGCISSLCVSEAQIIIRHFPPEEEREEENENEREEKTNKQSQGV